MRLLEALEKINEGTGLPQGDTFINIENSEANQKNYTDDKTGEVTEKWDLSAEDGKIYNVPRSVMRDIKELCRKGAKRVRITRTGLKADTRYTVVVV